MTPARATGSCLCGGVSFTIEGPLRGVVVCHCGQCRKTTGSRVEAAKARTATSASPQMRR